MNLVEKKNLRILYPSYGYILRHKETKDTYVGKIYLGKFSSPDDFEEIRDPEIADDLVEAMHMVEEKEKSLNKIGKIVANQVTDDVVALDIQEFYDNWKSGVNYVVGQYVRYMDILYKVLQPHTSQDGWTPDVTPSLYAKVLIDPSGETIPDWVQPDSTNAYMTGDKVKFEGEVYVSLIDNNIWSPATYPAGWQKVEG